MAPIFIFVFLFVSCQNKSRCIPSASFSSPTIPSAPFSSPTIPSASFSSLTTYRYSAFSCYFPQRIDGARDTSAVLLLCFDESEVRKIVLCRKVLDYLAVAEAMDDLSQFVRDITLRLTTMAKQVDNRQKELTHQVHRKILIRCLDSVKTLSPILVCAMKVSRLVILHELEEDGNAMPDLTKPIRLVSHAVANLITVGYETCNSLDDFILKHDMPPPALQRVEVSTRLLEDASHMLWVALLLLAIRKQKVVWMWMLCLPCGVASVSVVGSDFRGNVFKNMVIGQDSDVLIYEKGKAIIRSIGSPMRWRGHDYYWGSKFFPGGTATGIPMCRMPVHPSDPQLGSIYFPGGHKRLKEIVWSCNLSEKCCNFNCCPNVGMNGSYSRRPVNGSGFEWLIVVVGTVLLVLFALLVVIWRVMSRRQALTLSESANSSYHTVEEAPAPLPSAPPWLS
ncbi:hypothetical protein GPALN_013163 [Globodera pallida]|nr:hypothetical protein GPALN_013163 [Globodera pallida]